MESSKRKIERKMAEANKTTEISTEAAIDNKQKVRNER